MDAPYLLIFKFVLETFFITSIVVNVYFQYYSNLNLKDFYIMSIKFVVDALYTIISHLI